MSLEPADRARASAEAAAPARSALRSRLLADRAAFIGADADRAAAALGLALCDAIAELEPDCLGLYCAFGSEFNAAQAIAADRRSANLALALPFARKSAQASMEYRRWDGAAPEFRDECGIGSSQGVPVVPDVVVIPCVGYTVDAHRLGYGGGYYDRWLAAHAQVVAIGVAWSFAKIETSALRPEAHDIPLAFIVTELGVR